MPSSPVVDTSGSAAASGASSISFSVVTSGNDEVIALIIANGSTLNPARTVSSITGASFALYGTPWSGTIATQFQGSQATEVEIWTAPIAVASTVNITINFSGSCTGINVVYLAVQGTYSGSAYLDPNAVLPAVAGPANPEPLATFSTTLADDLLWNSILSGYLGTYGFPPSGWGAGPTRLENVTNCTIQQVSYTKSVSAVQTGAMTGQSSTSNFDAISIVFAFTADAQLVLQTFVTTICT